MELFISPAAFAISANIPITVDNAKDAPASFFPSIMDNAATAAAITPIATVITIRLPFTLFAPLVAAIIPVITKPRMVTAPTPFANPSRLIILIRMETAANAPIATENAKIVAATFAVCCPLDMLVTFTNALTNNKNPLTNTMPAKISSGFNNDTNLQTPTISNIDTEIDINKPPSFAI